MKVFKNIQKKGSSQILFSWDWHEKSILHCNGFSSLGRTISFEFSFLQRSTPILLAFFSAKSANPTVFRITSLLVTEIFLCEAYRFQKTSQTSDAQMNTPQIVLNSSSRSGPIWAKNYGVIYKILKCCALKFKVPCTTQFMKAKESSNQNKKQTKFDREQFIL